MTKRLITVIGATGIQGGGLLRRAQRLRITPPQSRADDVLHLAREERVAHPAELKRGSAFSRGRQPTSMFDGRPRLSTFVLIHGAGDGGWSWHLVEAELRARGHDVVAPDLPAGDESLTLGDYAAAVVTAIGDRTELVVVGHSFGAFTAPIVAARSRRCRRISCSAPEIASSRSASCAAWWLSVWA